MTQKQIKEELGWLGRYCDSGRYYFARPFVEGGCDNFEADYVINELLKVVESIGSPQEHRSRNLLLQGPCQVWDTCLRTKGEYQKAIDYFTAVRDFDAQRM